MGSDSTDTNDCTPFPSPSTSVSQIDPGSYCFLGQDVTVEKAGSGIKISGLPYGGDMVCESPTDTIKDCLTDIIVRNANSFQCASSLSSTLSQTIGAVPDGHVCLKGVPMVSKITADDTITVSTTLGHYKTTCQGDENALTCILKALQRN